MMMWLTACRYGFNVINEQFLLYWDGYRNLRKVAITNMFLVLFLDDKFRPRLDRASPSINCPRQKIPKQVLRQFADELYFVNDRLTTLSQSTIVTIISSSSWQIKVQSNWRWLLVQHEEYFSCDVSYNNL